MRDLIAFSSLFAGTFGLKAIRIAAIGGVVALNLCDSDHCLLAQDVRVVPSQQAIVGDYERKKAIERQKKIDGARNLRAQAAREIEISVAALPDLATEKQQMQSRLERAVEEKKSLEVAVKEANKTLKSLETEIMTSSKAKFQTVEMTLRESVRSEEAALCAALSREPKGIESRPELIAMIGMLSLSEKNRLKSTDAYQQANLATRSALDAVLNLQKEILGKDPGYVKGKAELLAAEENLKKAELNQKRAGQDAKIARERLNALNTRLAGARRRYTMAQQTLQALGVK